MRVVALGVGHFHSPIYVGGNGVTKYGHDLVGMHEDDPEIAAYKANRMGLAVVTDPEKLLDETKPDFAIVMGPTRRMPELLKMVIERDIPFLVEKPVARSAAELRPVLELAKKKGLFGAVAFCFRWHPGVQLIGEWMKQGRLGRPGFVRMEYYAGPASRYPAMNSPWVLHRSETGGGCIMNVGIHALDVLQYLGLEPAYIHGVLAQPWNQADYEDLSSLWMRCGDAVASVECGYVAAGSGFALEMKAEHANVSLRKGVLTLTNRDKSIEEHRFADSDYREEMLSDLLARCERGEASPVPLEVADASLKLIDSLYQENGVQPTR